MATKSKKAIVQVRVDEDVKSQAVEVLTNLGMDTSTAINVFLRQVVAENGLPFQPKIARFNEVTISAIKESDEMVANGAYDANKSVDDLFDEVLGEHQ
ncbi:type II toxin-antitoxin system RelB/DinJ family antitoxin [Planococcus sp. CP5-4]|uniref:type II toxin-antitoxin system RelB/DinJ family antitoxin n=1 Tax=unclassified Planococcus (in: firmicutes) TaxID=2662419 RepID=UPI001C2171B6|nr:MULTISPECIES: type II toxin-antitoxin system RelB/DinJ family antitoxin [unclassified Planococcus (in: firmicutes)]MBU9673893.1 type II toxin-antitoxin system RelB/DinJ family antitoxin [Planococcus sp. CP5-4_YE]MBV0909763.1 type II toxin-antitoxin system RelB/DinJ family antitoxin [Planococcus sp. CP5-4_UN]MBW6065247.1 type II toxin-antitoxin system RelB/DinJ family antitoxin [Planococcus sp. CP5-4]